MEDEKLRKVTGHVLKMYMGFVPSSNILYRVTRNLMAKAWDEGFKAGDRNPGFQDDRNPYRV